MSLATFLQTTATHQRNAPTTDSIGGAVANYSTLTTFSCAVWPKSSDLARMFARDAVVGDWIIATDSDLGVKAQDRVQVGSTYYTVHGFETFSNSAVSNDTLYLINASRMTV